MAFEEEKTRCVGLASLTFESLPAGWTVYRVRTRSSTYTLGLFVKGGERHVAVLRGRSNGMGQEISVMDSEPDIGEESLFDVPPSDWVGKPLAIGTITTSPVTSVETETDKMEITSVVNALAMRGGLAASQTRTSAPPPELARYPLNYVEGLENTAAWLRRIANQPKIAADIAQRAEWTQRAKIAMVNARQALEDLARDEHFR